MDWKQIVATVAPTLATALGGPLAGLATKAIAEAFNLSPSAPGSPDGDAAALEAAVAGATPADLLKLKEADHTFKAQMKALDVDLERISMEDRSSARVREAQVGGYTTTVLAYGIVGAFIAMVGLILVQGGLPTMVDSALAGTLIGYLSAKAEQVCSYYYGSSAGSRRKTELLGGASAQE